LNFNLSLKMWSTVCEGILSVIVGACGLMGNGAVIAVLCRPAFKETFHKLLISLSVFDSLFIGKKKMFFKSKAIFYIKNSTFFLELCRII
jgi:hypothetical protein